MPSNRTRNRIRILAAAAVGSAALGMLAAPSASAGIVDSYSVENATSLNLTTVSAQADSSWDNNPPQVGRVIRPGTNDFFNKTFYPFLKMGWTVKYQIGALGSVAVVTTAGTARSGSNKPRCSVVTSAGQASSEFRCRLDPKNRFRVTALKATTTMVQTGDNPQRAAQLVGDLCAQGALASCTATRTAPASRIYSTWKDPASTTFTNTSSVGQQQSLTWSDTRTTTTQWGVSAGVELGFGKKLLGGEASIGLSVGAEYGESTSNSRSYSETYSLTAPPQKKVWLAVRQEMWRVQADITAKMDTTTIVIKNYVFDIPVEMKDNNPDVVVKESSAVPPVAGAQDR